MVAKTKNLTNDERAFIKDNASKMTDTEIAKTLGRNPITVKKNRERLGIKKVSGGKVIQIDETDDQTSFDRLSSEEQSLMMEHQLRASPRYEELQRLFSPDELETYVRRWSSYTVQFRADVMATEETQIDQLVRYELLMDGNLKDRRGAEGDIIRLEEIIAAEERVGLDAGRNLDRVFQIEAQIAAMRGSQGQRTGEYVKLQEKHGKILFDLKGTRAQRIKDVESGKRNFMDFVKLMQDRDYEEREARNMELARIAAQKAYGELGDHHPFLDDTFDRLIINEETIGWEDKDE